MPQMPGIGKICGGSLADNLLCKGGFGVSRKINPVIRHAKGGYSMKDQVIVFDTTLRDGEQSPGASMNTAEKLRLGTQMEKLGVDVLEAGFPAASPGDLEAVQLIAQKIRGLQVAGLARASKQDIDVAWEAVKEAAHPRIHTFIATSDIHLEHKLKMSREEVIKEAVNAVKHAKAYTDNVEFSAEDGSRSDRDYLCKVFEAAIEAGATTINLPDTVGYALPHEFGRETSVGSLAKDLFAVRVYVQIVIWIPVDLRLAVPVVERGQLDVDGETLADANVNAAPETEYPRVDRVGGAPLEFVPASHQHVGGHVLSRDDELDIGQESHALRVLVRQRVVDENMGIVEIDSRGELVDDVICKVATHPQVGLHAVAGQTEADTHLHVALCIGQFFLLLGSIRKLALVDFWRGWRLRRGRGSGHGRHLFRAGVTLDPAIDIHDAAICIDHIVRGGLGAFFFTIVVLFSPDHQGESGDEQARTNEYSKLRSHLPIIAFL